MIIDKPFQFILKHHTLLMGKKFKLTTLLSI
jgi:hypothetical protein